MMNNDITEKIVTEILRENPDHTRRISITEQQRLDEKWEQTASPEMTGNALLSEMGSAGEKLQLSTNDTPELRAQLNNVNRRYRFLELFAEGGFGKIYRAKDRALERTVIIKSLRKEYVGDKASVEKFISEAKLNAQLDHPAIVPLYSLDTDAGGGLHLAMKFIDGITMKEFLTRLKVKYNLNRITQAVERQSLRNRLEYFIKICQAIEYSHSREIVHGDLKPDNIMLGAYGEVYIMDWGTAAPPGTYRKGAVEGTPGYLAPETLNTGIVNQSGDVFSLGMILFELVTLHRGVEGENIREITAKIRSGIFEPVRHIVPHLKIQPQLRAIIYKALEVDPELRYQDVKILAEDVRRYMFHEEISAQPDNMVYKLLRRMYHNRVKTFTFLSIFLLCCAATVAYSLYRENRLARETGSKVLQRVNFQFNTDQQGTLIDKYLLHLQNQLTAFGANLLFVLENPLRQSYNGPVYNAGSFSSPTTSPPDLVYSPAYHGKISLQYPVYSAAQPLSATDLEESVRKIYPLRHMALDLLLQSNPSLHLTPQNRNTLVDQLLSGGLPARNLFALLDNGVMVSFPGSDDQGGKQDFRTWKWYQKAVGEQRIFWGGPYIDSRGNHILPCAMPIIDSRGKMLGAAGIDISFAYVSKMLINANSPENMGLRKYLIDQNGRVLLSSRQQSVQAMTGASPKLKQPGRFVYLDQLNKMIATQTRQQEFEADGKMTMLSYCPIPQLGWFFVQVVDSDRIKDIPQNILPRLLLPKSTIFRLSPQAEAIKY